MHKFSLGMTEEERLTIGHLYSIYGCAHHASVDFAVMEVETSLMIDILDELISLRLEKE